jgi:acid phosphatase type 7
MKRKSKSNYSTRALVVSLTLVLTAISLVVSKPQNTIDIQAAPVTTILFPTDDTLVRADLPNNNYGTKTSLEVDGSPIKITYLKFNLQPLAGSQISKARLSFRVLDSSPGAQHVKRVVDTSWSEMTLKYSTRPDVGALVQSFPGGTAGSWIEVDVTTAVTERVGHLMSLAIDSTAGDGLDIYSEESATDKISLIVDAVTTETSSPTPSPSLTPTTPTPVPTPTILATATPIAGVDPVIAAAGDIACGAESSGAACRQMQTSDLLIQMNPTAVLLLGDNQYENGGLTDFNNFYNPSWGRLKSVTYPAVGNHEYLTTNASGYFDYFNGIGNQTGQAGDRTKGYYAFDVGGWRLYALNSNCSRAGGCGAGSPQEQWLRADLTANSKSCALAYFHHPLYSSGSRISTAVRPLYQALYDNNAELVLAGHEHNYERFAPQNANGQLDTTRGIREFVVGTGGRNFTQFTHTEVNSEVRNANTFGVLKLVLKQTSYDFQFVPIAGSTFTDSGTQTCH